MRKVLVVVSCVFVAFGIAASSSAGEKVAFAGQYVDEGEIEGMLAEVEWDTSQNLKTPSFGPNNWSSWVVGPSDAAVRNGTVTFDNDGNSLEFNGTAGTASFTLPVHLPHGAVFQYFYYWYYDNITTANPSLGFYRGGNTGGSSLVLGLDPGGSWSGGNTSYFAGPVSHTVDNWNYQYYVLALFNKQSSTVETRFYRGIAWYKYQISPAPASATFSDVPTTHPFFREIQALVDSGITAGCGSGNFCPSQPLTREQMAAFLARALGLSWSADVTP